MQAEHYITHTKPYFCYMATTLIRQSVLKTTLRRRPFATFPASISHNTGTSRNATQQAWLAPEVNAISLAPYALSLSICWQLFRQSQCKLAESESLTFLVANAKALYRFVIVGSVLAGAGWYLARSARGPDGLYLLFLQFFPHLNDWVDYSDLEQVQSDAVEWRPARREYEDFKWTS